MFLIVPIIAVAIGVFDAMNDTAQAKMPDTTPAYYNAPMPIAIQTPQSPTISVSYQPTGWACNGIYYPAGFVESVSLGATKGLLLHTPKTPNFNHFIHCDELVDIQG